MSFEIDNGLSCEKCGTPAHIGCDCIDGPDAPESREVPVTFPIRQEITFLTNGERSTGFLVLEESPNGDYRIGQTLGRGDLKSGLLLGTDKAEAIRAYRELIEAGALSYADRNELMLEYSRNAATTESPEQTITFPLQQDVVCVTDGVLTPGRLILEEIPGIGYRIGQTLGRGPLNSGTMLGADKNTAVAVYNDLMTAGDMSYAERNILIREKARETRERNSQE